MLVNLQEKSGLSLAVDSENYSLKLGEGIVSMNVNVRTMGQMKEVLLDKAVEDEKILYYMYRDVHIIKDEEELRRRGLRYDITIIPPGKLGREFMKTAGHYHPPIPGRNTTFPEVYEVLYGEADYLLQKKKENSDEIIRTVVVKAKVGNKVLIPPGYGHITINSGNNILVMANWVSDNFSSVYEPIKEKKGGAYYQIENEKKEKEWIFNTEYLNKPVLEIIAAGTAGEFNYNFSKPLYNALYEKNSLLDILK